MRVSSLTEMRLMPDPSKYLKFPINCLLNLVTVRKRVIKDASKPLSRLKITLQMFTLISKVSKSVMSQLTARTALSRSALRNIVSLSAVS